jgi:hypothetical protein
MRNVLIVTALVTMVFVPTLPTAAAPNDASAATKRVRAAALADCQRQAKAQMFGNRAIQRRNFLKNCMIDRMFYGGIN